MTSPLVFLHGWCCDAWHFDPQVEFFSPHRSVLSIPWKQRLEQKDGAITLEVAAHDIEALCHEAAFNGAPILVGHSMGGMLAAMIAAAGRMEVAGIVVIDTTWPFTPAAAQAFRSFLPALEADFATAAREFFTTRLERPEDDPAINARVVEGVVQSNPTVALALFNDLQVPDRLPRAESVPVPILGIASALQFLDRDNLLSHAKQAWFGQVAGCGHTIMLQAPDQLNAMLARFIGACETA